MTKLFAKFAKSEDGATAIEYALIAAGISVAIVATVLLLGGQIDTVFNDILTALGG